MEANAKATTSIYVTASYTSGNGTPGIVHIDGRGYPLTPTTGFTIYDVNDTILHSIEVEGVKPADIRLIGSAMEWVDPFRPGQDTGGLFKFTNPGAGAPGTIFIIY